jgi:hypothetical protein
MELPNGGDVKKISAARASQFAQRKKKIHLLTVSR